MKSTCPVCENESVFGPFGSIRRERVLCPTCGTVERHRLLYLYLRDQTNVFRDELSVVHFSPNPGLYELFRRQPNLWYTAVNRAPDNGTSPLEVDLTRTHFPSDHFDVEICYHVLEHIADDRRAMSELYRVLKPNGWAAVQVPLREGNTLEDPRYDTPELRALHYGQSNHVRYYGRQDTPWQSGEPRSFVGRSFAGRLTATGFDVEVVRPALRWNDETIEKYRLVRDEEIYVLRKKP